VCNNATAIATVLSIVLDMNRVNGHL